MNGYKLIIHTDKCVKRFEPKYSAAQKFLDNEVLKDCVPFVPMRTGNLVNSGIRGTNPGSGEVIYDAPYAKAVYYGLHLNFNTSKHPQACALWFEKAKALKKNDWINGVNKLMRG